MSRVSGFRLNCSCGTSIVFGYIDEELGNTINLGRGWLHDILKTHSGNKHAVDTFAVIEDESGNLYSIAGKLSAMCMELIT